MRRGEREGAQAERAVVVSAIVRFPTWGRGPRRRQEGRGASRRQPSKPNRRAERDQTSDRVPLVPAVSGLRFYLRTSRCVEGRFRTAAAIVGEIGATK